VGDEYVQFVVELVDRYLTRSDGLVTENANAAYHLTALHQYLTSARENAICSTR